MFFITELTKFVGPPKTKFVQTIKIKLEQFQLTMENFQQFIFTLMTKITSVFLQKTKTANQKYAKNMLVNFEQNFINYLNSLPFSCKYP